MRFILLMLRSLSLRCPNCRKSKMPRNLYVFHEACGACGYVYTGESGDFWGSVVFNYMLAAIIGLSTAAVLISLDLLTPEQKAYTSAFAGLLSILLLYPFAKSMWVYVLYYTRGQYEEYRAGDVPPKG